MRKALAAVLVGGLCVVASVPARAKTVTVTGQVIDLYCYVRNRQFVGMNHGPDRECAVACVRWEGQPAGLLTADGKVYQLAGGLVANNNAKIWPHLTHTVTVTGEITVKDGMPMIAADDLTMVRSDAR